MDNRHDTIIIIGSGMMGSGIAACSAASGRRTILSDTDRSRAEKGADEAREKLRYLQERGLVSTEEWEHGCDLLVPSRDYREERERACLVIEAVTENLELKQKVFADLDRTFPEEIPIASNTSGLRITDISNKMEHPERAVTAHFWFPAHLIPLVEVVIGEKTSSETAEQVKNELLRWKKAPVIVKKDLPGQLANRILQAVIREAVNIVEIGLASAEDVDTAIKMGMGIRLPVWGPLEHVDTVGMELCKSVQDTVLPGISSRISASPQFQQKIDRRQLGVKTGHGFYDWTKKDHAKLEQLRDDFIVNAVRFMRENP